MSYAASTYVYDVHQRATAVWTTPGLRDALYDLAQPPRNLQSCSQKIMNKRMTPYYDEIKALLTTLGYLHGSILSACRPKAADLKNGVVTRLALTLIHNLVPVTERRTEPDGDVTRGELQVMPDLLANDQTHGRYSNQRHPRTKQKARSMEDLQPDDTSETPPATTDDAETSPDPTPDSMEGLMESQWKIIATGNRLIDHQNKLIDMQWENYTLARRLTEGSLPFRRRRATPSSAYDEEYETPLSSTKSSLSNATSEDEEERRIDQRMQTPELEDAPMQPEEDPSPRTEVQNGDDDTVTREARRTETRWNNNTTDNCPERHRYNDSRDASYPSSTTTEDDGTDMDSIPSTDSLVRRWLDGIPTTEEDNEAQARDKQEEDAATPAPADEETKTKLEGNHAAPCPDDEDMDSITSTDSDKRRARFLRCVRRWAGDEDEIPTTEEDDEAQNRDRPEEDATTPAPADEEMETEPNESYATPYPDDEDANNSTTIEPHEEPQEEDEEEMSTPKERDERTTSPVTLPLGLPPGPTNQEVGGMTLTYQLLVRLHYYSHRLEELVQYDPLATLTKKKLAKAYGDQMRDEITQYLYAPCEPSSKTAAYTGTGDPIVYRVNQMSWTV